MTDVPNKCAAEGAHSTAVGWRVWRLRGFRLCALAMRYEWTPGSNTASCLSGDLELGGHRPPGSACRCGFWALFDRGDCTSLVRNSGWADGAVIGLVHAWGDVAIHGNEGFRAEHARVACLFTDRLTGMPRWVTRLDERRWTLRAWRLQQVSERYGVPLLSRRDAERNGLLAEFGVTASGDQLIDARG